MIAMSDSEEEGDGPYVENIREYSISYINTTLIHSGKLDEVKKVLDNSLNIVSRRGGESLLMVACSRGSINCVQYLIDVGVDVNYYTNDGSTALIKAVKANRNSEDIIRKLLLAGANPNQVSSSKSVLYYAVQLGKISIIQLLLEHGADPKLVNIDGTTPLIYLLSRRERVPELNDICQLLVRHGDKLPKKYINPSTNDNLFHLLAKEETVFLRDAIANCEDLNSLLGERNSEKLTPFQVAVKHDQIENVRLLYQTGKIDVNDEFNAGPTLDMAFDECAVESIEFMLRLPEIVTSYRINWVQWWIQKRVKYLSSGDGSKDKIRRIFIQLEKLDPEPKNELIMVSCQCRVMDYLVDHQYYSLIESMLLNKERTNTDPNQSCCLRENNLLRLINNYKPPMLSSEEGIIAYNRNFFRILQLLVRSGIDPNGGDCLRRVKNETHARVLLRYGAKITQPITNYSPRIWKVLCLHSKVNLNQMDYISQEPTDEIPNEYFFPFSNGICWNLESFFGYLTLTLEGINEYDSFSPWPGQRIWSSDDYKNLKKHSMCFAGVNTHDYASLIIKYLDIKDQLKVIPKEMVDLLDQAGSIFWARGEVYDQAITELLTDDELVIWNQQKVHLANNYMPPLPTSISNKIERLKQDYLYRFEVAYRQLSSEAKQALGEINQNLTSQRLDKLFQGVQGGEDACIMTSGSYMVKAYKRLISWKA